MTARVITLEEYEDVKHRAYMAGLDAAREAVEALTDPVPDVERTMWTTNEILAAIDALREERK